jgi:hypothetical protein
MILLQMINHDRMYLFIYSLKTMLENNQHLQQCIVMVEFHAGSQVCVTYSLGHSSRQSKLIRRLISFDCLPIDIDFHACTNFLSSLNS